MTMLNGKLMVFNGPGKPLELRTETVRPPQRDEILVRNLFTTICGSDLHTYSGHRKEACPTVLGHEIVGEIVDLGAGHAGVDQRNQKIAKGDIITWSIFSSDPDSANARSGMPQKGEHLFKYGHGLVTANDAFHGGLAEYCILKHGTAILKIAPEIPLPIAATINCAIATVAGAIRVSGELKGKRVVVFGAGMLGITTAAMCREAGAAWIAMADVSAGRLSVAADFGASESFDLSQDGEAKLRSRCDQFPGCGVDYVFDMTGAPDAMELGVSLLTVGGRAIWIGAVFNTRKVQLNAEWVVRNIISIQGLHNYNYEDFEQALQFITRNWKKYPFERVVEKEFDLIDADKAFAYAAEKKPLRVGIRI